MIVQLHENLVEGQIRSIQEKITSLGFKVSEVKTQVQRYLIGIGTLEFDIRLIGQIEGVRDVHRVSDQYKLVSRKWKVASSSIDLGDGLQVGGGSLALMAGPCSIESEEQVEGICKFLASQNVRIMRGGAFKPRTSPYAFRGMGLEGLKMFHRVAKSHGIKIITEVMAVEQVEPMYEYVDIYQVGARNTQNFTLLDALGRVDKPVLIKRGMSGTIEELLQSAEYVFSGGNEKLILCERGIRTYEKAYRNTFDVNAVPVLKEKTHLPVVVDPSHGIGIRRFVDKIALAGAVAGADGVLVEIHERPEVALSDGEQTLNFEEARSLFLKLQKLHGLDLLS